MSRRVFVRRLVAAGMAFGTAVSYAHLLSPERAPASAQQFGDGYEPSHILSLEMVPDDLDRVIRLARVRVKGVASAPGQHPAYLHLYRSPRRTPWPDAVIGSESIVFTRANRPQAFTIPLFPNGITALQKQKKTARIGVSTNEGDDSPAQTNAILYRR